VGGIPAMIIGENKTMYKIVFVILHYETLSDTQECIESLLKYLNQNIQIVVVDNGSINGKLNGLESQYKEEKNIYFLYSKKNLGFANGNNIGYGFAKYKLGADIIVLANNDLIFKQEDFVEKLTEAYDKTEFDVAGPQIISLVDHKNQNPVRVQYSDLADLNKRLIKFQILYILSRFNLDLRIQKRIAKEVVEFKPGEQEDFQLHGACMFFAGKYLERYEGLCDKTFMYGEENILKYIVNQEHMQMKYLQNLVVYHKEGASTGVVYGKGKEKRQFYYKWNINSCKILKKMMKHGLK